MPKKTSNTKTMPVTLRLTVNMIKAIDLAIELGQGNDRNGIIRMAIANYLSGLKIPEQMKKEKLHE